jgi:hypothetical protein
MVIDVNLIRDNYLFIIAPEFKTLDVDKLNIINSHILFSSEDVNENVFLEKTNRAIAYLTAYNLTDQNPLGLNIVGSIGGSLTKVRKKLDKMETEYNYSSSISTRSKLYDSPFSSNKYGKMFYTLLESCKPTGCFVV